MNKIVPFKQIIRLSLLMVYKLINDQNFFIFLLLGREKGGGVGGGGGINIAAVCMLS